MSSRSPPLVPSGHLPLSLKDSLSRVKGRGIGPDLGGEVGALQQQGPSDQHLDLRVARMPAQSMDSRSELFGVPFGADGEADHVEGFGPDQRFQGVQVFRGIGGDAPAGGTLMIRWTGDRGFEHTETLTLSVA